MHTANSLRFLCFCIFFILFQANSFAQERVIELSYTYEERNEEFIITALNSSSTYYTVVVKFDKLFGLRANDKLPAMKVVPPGSHRLLKLEKSGSGQPDFSYRFVYWKGIANPRIEDVQYVLPFSPALEVGVKEVGSLSDYLKQDSDDDHYAIGFNMIDGDTILASRKGVVEVVEQENQTENLNYTFTRERNYIRIRHDDGTIANYQNFKNNSSFVEVGTEVLPGTPLALAIQTREMGDALMIFSVFYLVIEPDDFVDTKDWDSYKYYKPKFALKEGLEYLKVGSNYRGYINTELITQELSKREKKRYLSKK